MLKVNGTGPKNARIMIVGEAPGSDEEIKGVPFVGVSGQELTRQLHEAGLRRDDCYLTNVSKYRPPNNEMGAWLTDKKTDLKRGFIEHAGRYMDPRVQEGLLELDEEIERVNPEIIIGLGNTPLWALHGKWGITNWRGSEIVLGTGRRFVPTLHPAGVLRNWATRAYVIQDLKQRVAKRLREGFVDPVFDFNTSPTFDEVMAFLDTAHGDLCGDIETADGHIICLGLATSNRKALCIPFRNEGGVYWGLDDQRDIVSKLSEVCNNSDVNWIGQNWNYDAQYFEADFGWTKMPDFDTYIAQSVLFPGMERDLGFLSSMYCDWHQYWKMDAKDWGKIADFQSFFRYNCRDVVHTFEVAQKQREKLTQARLNTQFEERMRYGQYVYRMMRRGVNRDDERTAAMIVEVDEAIQEREVFMTEAIGKPVTKIVGTKKKPEVSHLYNSPAQVADLFYKQLGLKKQLKRGTGAVTTDDKALKAIAEKHPGKIADLAMAILECRSFDKLKANFLEAELDPDGRFRSSWSPTGAETFRLTSGKNAFHRGGPLQNVTTGSTGSGRKLPNLRTCIIPDAGYIYFNTDLERADLQVVAWEAEDQELMAILKEHEDIHTINAKALFNLRGEPTYEQRQFGKKFVHLCVDEQHEALTRNGWKKVSEIQDGEEILVANPNGSGAYFAKIDEWFRGQCFSPMLHFEGEAVDQLVTFDHKMSYKTDSSGAVQIGTASTLPKSASLPKSVVAEGNIQVERPALLCAFHADGSLDPQGNVTFHFKKQRKIDRLRTLLTKGEYTERSNKDGTTTFYIPHRFAKDLTNKVLTSECLDWRHEDAAIYLTEQVYWDGHKGPTNAEWMSSVKKEHAELAHTLAHLHGFGSQFHNRDNYAYLWSLNNRTWWKLENCQRVELQGLGRIVYCPVTPTGFWLTRRNGKISLTGNTNYGGKERTCAAGVGCTVHEASLAQKRWFEIHPGIKAWHERTQALLLGTRTVTNRFGYRRVYFDRVDGLLPEALAWVPQSTVSILISLQHMAMEDELGERLLQIQMQVHDSLNGQILVTGDLEDTLRRMRKASEIAVPYPDPLYIPLELALSESSWGEVEKRAWPQ